MKEINLRHSKNYPNDKITLVLNFKIPRSTAVVREYQRDIPRLPPVLNLLYLVHYQDVWPESVRES